MNGYAYFLDNGTAQTQFVPYEKVIISLSNEEGNYKRTVNDIVLPPSLYQYWIDNIGTPVYFVCVRLSDNFEQFRGQLRLKKNEQSKRILTLEASENNLLSQVEAISSEVFNILTQSIIYPVFLLKNAGETAPDGYWTLYPDVWTSSFGLVFRLYVAMACKGNPGGWYEDATYGFMTPYVGTTPVPYVSTAVISNYEPNYYYVREIVEAPTNYFYVTKASISFEDLYGNEFTDNSIVYKNGVLLKSAINSQLLKLPTPTTVKSSFLFGDTPETGNAWTSVEINGHVPGLLQMHSVSDIKFEDASSPATIANISLSAIFNTLKNILNCYFFKDEDGYLRIEHVSYKRTATVRDITALSNTQNPPTLEYSDDSRERKINFQAVAAVNAEYVNTYIEFSNYDADPTKTRTNAYDGIVTDFRAAINESEKIPTDGVLLVSKNGSNNPTDFFEFTNIIENLWLHEANYSEFKIRNTGSAITAESLAYVVKHETVKLAESEILFNELDVFETFYSATKLGIVDSARIDTQTYQIEIDLKFER